MSYSALLFLCLLLLKLSVIIINHLALTMLPKSPFLWFILPTAHSASCGQIHFPLFSCISPNHPKLPPPYTPSQPSQLFNPFFPNSQPLIDLPIGTVASHHFPFPLLLCLFCWSIRVGEEEQEMKMGDSLSPCQVAVGRHGAVRCRWWGLEICWTHEKLGTLEKGGDPEGG